MLTTDGIVKRVDFCEMEIRSKIYHKVDLQIKDMPDVFTFWTSDAKQAECLRNYLHVGVKVWLAFYCKKVRGRDMYFINSMELQRRYMKHDN